MAENQKQHKSKTGRLDAEDSEFIKAYLAGDPSIYINERPISYYDSEKEKFIEPSLEELGVSKEEWEILSPFVAMLGSEFEARYGYDLTKETLKKLVELIQQNIAKVDFNDPKIRSEFVSSFVSEIEHSKEIEKN